MQNPLIEQYRARQQQAFEKSQSQEAAGRKKPAGLYHAIFLIIGVALSFWSAYSVEMLLAEFSVAALGKYALTLSVLALLMVFQSIFLVKNSLRFTLLLIEILITTVFILSPSGWFIAGALAFIVASIVGVFLAEKARAASHSIQFGRYAHLVIKGFSVGAALFISCLVIMLYQKSGGVHEKAFVFLYDGAAPLASRMLGVPLSATTTVSEFFSGYVNVQLARIPEFETLSPAMRKSQVASAVREVEERLLGGLPEKPKRNETIVSYLTRLAQGALMRIEEAGFGPAISGALLVLIFFTLRGIIFFIKIPLLIMCFIIYQFLRTMGVVYVTTELKEKEILQVS